MDGSTMLSTGRFGVSGLKQRFGFIGAEPVAPPNCKLLCPFHAAHAGGQLGPRQAGIGGG